jgi:ribosome biogenesis GTPase A
MLDMPGVLWPKFEDQSVALNLAFTGAIKDDVIDIESVSMKLLEALSGKYPKLLVERYKIEIDNGDDGKVLLEKVGRKRGMLLPGGIVNTERAAITVLDEFRCAKLGRISLEFPPSGDSNEE